MIPLLKAAGGETHLINTASYAGFVSSPWSAAYNASKAGVIALSETLQAELQSTNVNVSVVCPGFFPSGLLLESNPAGDVPTGAISAAARRMFDRSTLTADQVADAIVGLIDKPQFLTILPAEARRAWRFKRFFPRCFSRVVAEQSNRLRDRMQAKLDAPANK